MENNTTCWVLRSSMNLHNEPWYYSGIWVRHLEEKTGYVHCIPGNAAQKSKILKLAFRKEAEQLAMDINKRQKYYTYTVEEIIIKK